MDTSDYKWAKDMLKAINILSIWLVVSIIAIIILTISTLSLLSSKQGWETEKEKVIKQLSTCTKKSDSLDRYIYNLHDGYWMVSKKDAKTVKRINLPK